MGNISKHPVRDYGGHYRTVSDHLVSGVATGGSGYGELCLLHDCRAMCKQEAYAWNDDDSQDHLLYLDDSLVLIKIVGNQTIMRKLWGIMIDYCDYWEKSWCEENTEELYRYLDGWNGFSGTEMDIFKQYGIQIVCDAACGFGAHTLAFASNGFDVSAFDISPKAVELTTYGLRKYGYDNVEVRLAGITDTGYESGTFDAAAAYAVIDHLTESDGKRAIEELMRIIKPQGLLLLSFDQAEEEDFESAHEELADGSMIYTGESSRDGMLYRPYDSDKISALISGYRVIEQWTNRKGSQFVILQKSN